MAMEPELKSKYMFKAKFKCRSVYANVGFSKAELIHLSETGEETTSKPLEINSTGGGFDNLNFKPGRVYIMDIQEEVVSKPEILEPASIETEQP